MPASGTSSQKDWRPPCTKAQDPEGYKRVGEIVETIILNGQNPSKKTFREIDPELFDSYKETSIKNTIASLKRKILARHREEELNTDNRKENSQVQDDSEDDEDYISGHSDFEGEDEQDNIYDDSEFIFSENKNINKDSTSIPSPRPTTVKFADNMPKNPILKNPRRTFTPEMAQNKTRDETGSRNIMTCDVVNIPGNPNRVLMQIVEDEELTTFLRLQVCCNAGPMKDVGNNFKVTPHSDGKGCDVDIPISADFFLERNATILGYGHEADGRVRGPIKHMSTLRSRFRNEGNLYNVVETYTVSFGPLKVKKRVIDPKVKTKNIYCPTFIFYFEIDEEKATRKLKITLDGDEEEDYSSGNYANTTNPNHVNPAPFASHTSAQGTYSHHHHNQHPPPAAAGQSNPTAAATSAPYFSYSPNAAFFNSPPPPAPQNHQAVFSVANIHTNNPHFTAGPNHHAHYCRNPGNNHTTGTTSNTGITSPLFSSPPPPPPGVTIDPSLIVEYLRNLSFAGAAHQQQPQSDHQQDVNVATAAAGQNTGRESNFHPQVPSDTQGSHQHRSPSSTVGGTKFKRGERHFDVSASRDDFGHQRMLIGSQGVTVETVLSETAGENYLSPADYSQTSTEVVGNGFFPAVDDDL